MTAPQLVVVGDTVVDVDITGDVERVGPEGCVVLDAHSERRRPGAAALAAAFAVDDGADVTFLTAIGDDEPGHFLRSRLSDLGVAVVDLGLAGPTPQKWRLRTPDGTLLRVDRDCGEPAAVVADGAVVDAVLEEGDGVLVADYGRGVARAVASYVARTATERPVTWDPHTRGPHPPRGLDVLTPNEREAGVLDRAIAPRLHSEAEPSDVAVRLAWHFRASVALTRGSDGAVLAPAGGGHVEIPTTVARGDTCGAGDRFAACVAVERARGVDHTTAVISAVAAASRFVATGDGSAPPADGDAFELAASVRGRGGKVVATGGCFDLLHAGHVRLLEAARAMGDLLVVCLNSDDSVRRLKGPGRPVVGIDDRRRVLEALTCVDAVAVFHDDTPIRILERLQPHVFVKGADYVADELPERAVLARWGGRVAIVPLVDGRSTTRLIQLVRTEAV